MINTPIYLRILTVNNSKQDFLMKKILTLVILLSCSLASLAIPDPRKKNLKKARTTGKTISIQLPSRGTR